jgi:glycerol-3-phosphate cytidylyltransferase
MAKTVITFGTYDVFHYGHLMLLQRAKGCGDRLVVGVSTDALNISKKGRAPIFPENERKAIVESLRCVDHVFDEDSLEKKADYLREHKADLLVMGDDWRGRFDELSDICEVIYLPRTPAISTTVTIEKIKAS